LFGVADAATSKPVLNAKLFAFATMGAPDSDTSGKFLVSANDTAPATFVRLNSVLNVSDVSAVVTVEPAPFTTAIGEPLELKALQSVEVKKPLVEPFACVIVMFGVAPPLDDSGLLAETDDTPPPPPPPPEDGVAKYFPLPLISKT
jgi:hypothetical protein